MTHKLLMTAAVVAFALATSIGIGSAEAGGGGFHGEGFHGGGFHHRAHPDGRAFRGNGLGYGGFVDYTGPDAAAESPPFSAVPQPASPVLALDRPPCRETTTVRVVIVRGTSCSRGTR
jgi:hypothetical protein